MDDRVLISCDLNDEAVKIDVKNISYVGALYFDVNEKTLGATLDFLHEHSDYVRVYCSFSGATRPDQIFALLDAGCIRVFLTEQEFSACLNKGIEREHLIRLAISIDLTLGETERSEVDRMSHLLAQYGQIDLSDLIFSGGLGTQEVFKHASRKILSLAHFYVDCSQLSIKEASKVLEQGQCAIVPSEFFSLRASESEGRICLSRLITDIIHSDRPDGLYPTIVTDERNVSLGLVYSSQHSIEKAVESGRGVYYSRSRQGLWVKGEESGNFQHLIRISVDCDMDAIQFQVLQKGYGFCHLQRYSCFGRPQGISHLEKTLQDRLTAAPAGSYTSRLFDSPKLLQAKIMEEASELCAADGTSNIADEMADLMYFALTKCIAAGVQFRDVERSLDRKSRKVTRRKGHPKRFWADQLDLSDADRGAEPMLSTPRDIRTKPPTVDGKASARGSDQSPASVVGVKIRMQRYIAAETQEQQLKKLLQRPSQGTTDDIINIVRPIINEVREIGDQAVLKYTHRYEKATSLSSPVLQAPFPSSLMQISEESLRAIDLSFENIRRFHAAQKENGALCVETMPGIACSRFSRPIERVGLYVPGGTAVLPSTALMLGVPAMVAGCAKIVFATPPRSDGTVTPEIVYIADRVGADSIVLAGGAQAVAALAYGTESVSKVDKILGPGNQYVTAGKMIVSNDTTAGVSIDMPAGPSEVLVIADKSANPAFVAADLLSQAEHGIDSQVILIAVDLGDRELGLIEDELDAQAHALPRVDIVRTVIEHSVTLVVKDLSEALHYSNEYAPEHLILQIDGAEESLPMVRNAGSVFVGPWAPESVGDYSAGTNHSLPTYGYARQYSGVNLSSFTKHITCSNLTKAGLQNVSGAVMQLAKVEGLEAHRRAVSIRLK